MNYIVWKLPNNHLKDVRLALTVTNNNKNAIPEGQ